MDFSAIRHSSKVNSSIISRSMISEINRNMNKEDSLHRKLRNLLERNMGIQKKIKEHEIAIKDERTVIIYQMNELTKAMGAKLNAFTDYSLTQQMFKNQELAHENIKDLMDKFEEIEKEETMMNKIKDNFQEMYNSYKRHKEVIEEANSGMQAIHEQCVENMRAQIQQKKQQIGNAQYEHQNYLNEIQRLRDQIQTFKQEEQGLEEEKICLKKEIEKMEKIIIQKAKKLKQMNQLTEIVIDKKNRYKIYDKISHRKKNLEDVLQTTRQLEIELNQLKKQSVSLLS